jgi:DNA-nicking Smr family endonuclease
MATNKNRSPVKSFRQLSTVIQKAGFRLKEKQDCTVELDAAEKVCVIQAEHSPDLTEEELFLTAMQNVKRASWRRTPRTRPQPEAPALSDPELENRQLMIAAVKGDFPISIPEHPEYIEGWVGVVGRKFLPNLRDGIYSIQGQIDLHGLNRTDAQIAVEDFIVRMSRYRGCCVKVIHGRGINSPEDPAPLKDCLQRLLATRRMSRYVVAYASAPHRDGGVGAVYVLLAHPSYSKKPQRKRKKSQVSRYPIPNAEG